MREAILLVGGLGSRLRPLTVTTPKPMLPVAGVPFVAHQLARLAAAGVDHVVLATSYKAEVFEGYLGDGAAVGLAVDYVTEREPLGTGGALRHVAHRLHAAPGDPVLVLNGDILSGHDMGAQLAAHAAARAAVTLHLVAVDDPRAYGCVPTDASGRVTEFLEKAPDPVSNQINAGCYVFSREVLDAIPHGRAVSVERETFPGLLAAGALVLGYREDAYWLDLGTPQAFVTGSRDLVLGRVSSPLVPQPGTALVLPGARVDPTARVDGGSTVHPGAVVGPHALVRGSVIGADAAVGESAVVEDSVLATGARIGARCRLEGVVVGDRADVGADCELPSGVRVWVDAVLAPGAVRVSADR